MGATYAAAFEDDPVWMWLCKQRMSVYPRLAPPFFAAETRHHVHLGSAYTVDGNNASALWAPPNKWRLSPADLVRWAPSAIRLFGTRLPASLSALSAVDKLHPKEPHWYLALLGTHPDHQGRGLGSAVLAPVLARCDAEGIPAYLESSKEANVSFYERHGFAVTQTMDFKKDGSAPRMWLMWREPQPQR